MLDAIEAVQGRPYGVCHASELLLVFGGLDELELSADEKALSQQMMTFWTTFAKTGRPADEAVWPAFSRANDLSLRLNTGSSAAKPGLASELCDFWDSFGNYSAHTS